jgi:hypothetical protein
LTLFDGALAMAGAFAAGVVRLLGGSRRIAWVVVGLLFVASAVPVLMIGASQRPTDLTFDDIRYDRIPARTAWVRMDGTLRHATGPGGQLYELADPANEGDYMTVSAPSPLALGPTMVTGEVSDSANRSGYLGWIEADVPAVPRRDEPFWLILIPAFAGGVLAIGIKAGYPVVRPERVAVPRLEPLGPGERLAARWTGRIRSEIVGPDRPQPCTLLVARDADMWRLTLAGDGSERSVPVRFRAPVRRIRLWRADGSHPGLDVRVSGADLRLEFDDLSARDRLASTLA